MASSKDAAKYIGYARTEVGKLKSGGFRARILTREPNGGRWYTGTGDTPLEAIEAAQKSVGVVENEGD